ncbi:MAG: NAD(P)H-dependent oxidoreductase subunit E [Gemmatimonadales bacterium]|nr:MAG: NAD(P)H-dependent oxidoreductase subunit E [Gemmatimonadales bacterium]
MSEATSSSGGSGGRADDAPFRNPGWAGNTGSFDLTEDQVRGEDYVGTRPPDGGHPSGAPTYPYMLEDKDPEAALFEGAHLERFEKIRSRYPDSRAALLPTLNLAQELRGHVSPATMREVSDLLELSEAYVRGVTTFYTMYNKAPVGRYLVQVCTNISCNLCGGDEVLAAFLEHAGTEMGETSEDGLFTITEVECLAACGFPTAVQINSRYFENVTPEDVPALLDRLRSEAKAETD